MKITQIQIENYKGFKGTNTIDLSQNFVMFVGENNTGKSTVFETIEFLKSGLPSGKTIEDIRNSGSAGHVSVTVKLQDNIKEVINTFSESKYEKYVFDEDGLETLLAKRSSEESTITQSGKQTKIDIKKITLWNPETSQFENPSGIDTVFKTLFEAQFVWADTNPKDIADFGSTKICGRLLNSTIGNFFETEQWNNFVSVHKETFHDGTDSLSTRTKIVEEKIQKILEEQYGSAKVKFNFTLPESTSFIKSGGINIDDGVDTSYEDKGSGMQRALALSIIQVYAQVLISKPDDNDSKKPLFLFIDEPEICLHPKAQKQLLEALEVISSVNQIFISTHSPYLLKSFEKTKHELIIFTKPNGNITTKPSTGLSLLPWSPSWGEINYSAYGIPTIEFHNELYGYIQEANNAFSESAMETFLTSKGLTAIKQWTRESGGVAQTPYNVTKQTFIRNKIHHPENTTMQAVSYTETELKESIDEMINII